MRWPHPRAQSRAASMHMLHSEVSSDSRSFLRSAASRAACFPHLIVFASTVAAMHMAQEWPQKGAEVQKGEQLHVVSFRLEMKLQGQHQTPEAPPLCPLPRGLVLQSSHHHPPPPKQTQTQHLAKEEGRGIYQLGGLSSCDGRADCPPAHLQPGLQPALPKPRPQTVTALQLFIRRI